MVAVKPIREVAAPAHVAVAPTVSLTVDIGCRWKADLHSFINDRAIGVYEEVNSQIASKTEDYVQQALLVKVSDPASLQRIAAARTARSPKPAPVIEYRVKHGDSQ